MSGKHDRHGQHRYGSVHKAARKGFAARMRAGEVFFYCWRCGEPITGKWDLGPHG